MIAKIVTTFNCPYFKELDTEHLNVAVNQMLSESENGFIRVCSSTQKITLIPLHSISTIEILDCTFEDLGILRPQKETKHDTRS